MTDGPPEGFVPFNFVTPQEVQAAQDRAVMSAQVVKHEVDNWIHGMSLDDLRAFRSLMSSIGEHGGGKRLGLFFLGQATALLSAKYNVCGGCGRNHDEEFLNDPAPAAEEQVEKPAPAPLVDMDALKKDVESREPAVDPKVHEEELIEYILKNDVISLEWVRVNLAGFRPTPPTTSLEFSMMKLYGLDDVWETNDGTEDKFLGFKCLNCLLHYGSIQDRMLKSVDECHGCFLKAANG
jgi:hypothetical protein